ncbi:hypothetical protein, conserved [Plasmodium gonderi]|uniref:Uncharacterized protein n=1 Tax=Plasmodium gonderi TaxID=77519 RepID=A0A1Y1JQE4_PLAGO|nr:hypothetical protein, conserved [Plasmodium gonderi]GAW83467.1 hypothetical protein, conserved [Plasmodium gonderi]
MPNDMRYYYDVINTKWWYFDPLYGGWKEFEADMAEAEEEVTPDDTTGGVDRVSETAKNVKDSEKTKSHKYGGYNNMGTGNRLNNKNHREPIINCNNETKKGIELVNNIKNSTHSQIDDHKTNSESSNINNHIKHYSFKSNTKQHKYGNKEEYNETYENSHEYNENYISPNDYVQESSSLNRYGHNDQNDEHYDEYGDHYDEYGDHCDEYGDHYDESGDHYDESGDHYDECGDHCDENGNHCDESGGYYDENGGYYDENGVYYDEYGGYYDEYGGYYDKSGFYYNEQGEYNDENVAPCSPNGIYYYDEKGLCYDENGENYNESNTHYDDKGCHLDDNDKHYCEDNSIKTHEITHEEERLGKCSKRYVDIYHHNRINKDFSSRINCSQNLSNNQTNILIKSNERIKGKTENMGPNSSKLESYFTEEEEEREVVRSENSTRSGVGDDNKLDKGERSNTDRDGINKNDSHNEYKNENKVEESRNSSDKENSSYDELLKNMEEKKKKKKKKKNSFSSKSSGESEECNKLSERINSLLNHSNSNLSILCKKDSSIILENLLSRSFTKSDHLNSINTIEKGSDDGTGENRSTNKKDKKKTKVNFFENYKIENDSSKEQAGNDSATSNRLASNEDHGDSETSYVPFVRRATRTLTFKNQGGLAGCLKVFQEKKKELMASTTNNVNDVEIKIANLKRRARELAQRYRSKNQHKEDQQKSDQIKAKFEELIFLAHKQKKEPTEK